MCGIFGAVVHDRSLRHGRGGERLIERLFVLSESRGKEAAGLAFADDAALTVYKAPVAARQLLRTTSYRALTRDMFANGDGRDHGALAFIGHSRLVTDGDRDVNRNNQPVMAGGAVGVHNGIIVNDDALWAAHPGLVRHYEVDSEVIFALIRHHREDGQSLAAATARTFAELEGAASIAALFDDTDQLLLATNNGSLYYRQATGALFLFASERYIIDRAAGELDQLAPADTVHVRPGEGAIVDMRTLAVERFSLGAPTANSAAVRLRPRQLSDRSVAEVVPARRPARRQIDAAALAERFPYVSMRDRLRRCVRCVLPETMPFVDFDDHGVCRYCRHHRPITIHGADALEAMVAPYRRRDGRPDCIVGVSGGRDSMFGLHYIKCVLGMNPVAYTYDWGMVTDLARRNVSRICGKLGIEHILVSADIPAKRDYIRANVDAWLHRPSLGTVPLFMAGDKAYFYYLQKAREQLGVELAFLCENLLERTDFKTGFAGIPPAHDDDHVYTLPVSSKLGMLRYYAGEFARNPRYINRSLIDSARAFAFYYLIDRRYHNLYRYVPWDEATVESTLIGSYGFELAEDTASTWRIGDGTAPFYNYIYHAIAGMSENDTFRSNQIRNGAITRAEALDRIDRDNRPRFPSIQWYLDTIRLDRPIEDVLAMIQAAPVRYERA